MDFTFHHCCLEIPLLKSEIHKREKVDYLAFLARQNQRKLLIALRILYIFIVFHSFTVR